MTEEKLNSELLANVALLHSMKLIMDVANMEPFRLGYELGYVAQRGEKKINFEKWDELIKRMKESRGKTK